MTINRREVTGVAAGAVGLAVASTVLAAEPKQEIIVDYIGKRKPVFHTPFDHVTGGGMAVGELCYLIGQDYYNPIEEKYWRRHFLRDYLLNMNQSMDERHEVILVTTGGRLWVTSINCGATFLFFKSLAGVKHYALENDVFALVDGTFYDVAVVPGQVIRFIDDEPLGHLRTADFVITCTPPAMWMLKNRIGSSIEKVEMA